MADVNKYINAKTGFWSSKKMASKLHNDPEYRHYSQKHIKQTFDEKDAWARHKIIYRPAKEKYGGKVQAPDVGRFQMDFADFTSFRDDTYKYLLCIIDIYSRYLITFKCKTRNSAEYLPLIESFIKNWNGGHYIRTEQKRYDIYDIKNQRNTPYKVGDNIFVRSGNKLFANRKFSVARALANKTYNIQAETGIPFAIRRPFKHGQLELDENNNKYPNVYSISSDNEFPASQEYRNLMQKYNIKYFYSMAGEHGGKTAVVDRLIRTLRTLLGRYHTHTNSTAWANVIDDFVDNYNHSKHRMIGVQPAYSLATRDKFEPTSHKQLKNKDNLKNIDIDFQVGDWVRIKAKRDMMHNKANLPYWNKEIYVIHSRIGNRFALSRHKKVIMQPKHKDKPYLFEPYHLQKVKKPNVSNENNPDNPPNEDKPPDKQPKKPRRKIKPGKAEIDDDDDDDVEEPPPSQPKKYPPQVEALFEDNDSDSEDDVTIETKPKLFNLDVPEFIQLPQVAPMPLPPVVPPVLPPPVPVQRPSLTQAMNSRPRKRIGNIFKTKAYLARKAMKTKKTFRRAVRRPRKNKLPRKDLKDNETIPAGILDRLMRE